MHAQTNEHLHTDIANINITHHYTVSNNNANMNALMLSHNVCSIQMPSHRKTAATI